MMARLARDAAGNITAMPNGSSYSYDAENHLLSTAGVNYTGVYPERSRGDGGACPEPSRGSNRVEKSNGTVYWYGAGGGGLDESNLSGSITNEYIFFGGARIARRDPSSNVFYYFSDHLGTARSIAEVPSGQTTATKCYDADLYPYGGERWYTDTCDSHYKFTGKERDPESGLDNFGARYDSSAIGRFMSPDWSDDPDPVPNADLSDPQTLNLYTMAGNNPESFADPDGHLVDECVAGGENPNCQAAENIPPPILKVTVTVTASATAADTTLEWFLLTGSNIAGLTEAATSGGVISAGVALGMGIAMLFPKTVGGACADDASACATQKSGNKTAYKKPKAGVSGKEGAKDVPSWAKGQRPKAGESGKDFAKRLCDEKYGVDNYQEGPGSEFSKIQKWGDRSFE